MSLVGKNKKIFSYTNADVREKNFLNKDFNKSQPYHSNFSQSRFENTSFSATKFKFCGFYEAVFKFCDFTGALFRKGNLQRATFEGCIIRASQFEQCKLGGASFNNCLIIGTKIQSPPAGFHNTKVLECSPPESSFSIDLREQVDLLKSNPFISKSRVFHLKKGKLNTATLFFLLSHFDEVTLTKLISGLDTEITKDFFTVSYVVRILTQLCEADKIA